MTPLDAIPADLGPWALVGLVVWLILSGRLVPRRLLDDEIRRSELWRKAAETWQAAASEAAHQIRDLHEPMLLTLELLKGLRAWSEQHDDQENHDEPTSSP